MNGNNDVEKSVGSHINFFVIQVASTFITSFFLAIWVAIQWGINTFIGWLQLSGVDQFVLWVFQGIFAVTTLIPVIVYYYVDTTIIWLRAQRAIKREKRAG